MQKASLEETLPPSAIMVLQDYYEKNPDYLSDISFVVLASGQRDAIAPRYRQRGITFDFHDRPREAVAPVQAPPG
jgi:hypothetical protein